MPRDGYLFIDSDLHIGEPDDLWARLFCAEDSMGSSTGGRHR